MPEEKKRVPRKIKKIISELVGEYQDDVTDDTLEKWEAHALLLHEKGLSFQEIDDTLNELFWSAAGEFGA